MHDSVFSLATQTVSYKMTRNRMDEYLSAGEGYQTGTEKWCGEKYLWYPIITFLIGIFPVGTALNVLAIWLIAVWVVTDSVGVYC